MGSLPLEGIRVVELGEAWAGPYGGTLLGDMGAEVIKVESIQRVPITRSPLRPAPRAIGYVGDEPGDRPWERFDSYNSANRNKLGITLDLTRPKGLTLLKHLVALSDIVIENYAAGQVQKLGIDYPALRAVKPDIIMISMPGFGVEGPYKGFVTLGDSIDAVAGHTALRGYPDEDLSQSSNILHPDAVAAITAVFAVLTALNFRLRTGEGQFIDMSQAESVMPHLGAAIMDYTMNGRVQPSLGNRHHSAAPHGCYRCKGEDKWVTLAVFTDEEWRSLCQVMGAPELADDMRFADVVSRWQHQDELDTLVQGWTSKHDNHEVARLLRKARICAGAVMTDPEIFTDPHIYERRFFLAAEHSQAGVHLYPGFPWKLSRVDAAVRLPPNCLGEHNRYVFGDILGLSEEELAELESERYIGTDYIPNSDVDRGKASPLNEGER